MHAVRRQTREDKKKMALAMRQKQLEALGMLVSKLDLIIKLNLGVFLNKKRINDEQKNQDIVQKTRD